MRQMPDQISIVHSSKNSHKKYLLNLPRCRGKSIGRFDFSNSSPSKQAEFDGVLECISSVGHGILGFCRKLGKGQCFANGYKRGGIAEASRATFLVDDAPFGGTSLAVGGDDGDCNDDETLPDAVERFRYLVVPASNVISDESAHELPPLREAVGQLCLPERLDFMILGFVNVLVLVVKRGVSWAGMHSCRPVASCRATICMVMMILLCWAPRLLVTKLARWYVGHLDFSFFKEKLR
jgi:hypothetical protein